MKEIKIDRRIGMKDEKQKLQKKNEEYNNEKDVEMFNGTRDKKREYR